MTPSLDTCPECDTLHRRHPLGPGEKARCTCCGAVIYRRPRRRPEHVLALVATALVVYVIANATPIVELEVQGLTSSTTLFGAVLALWAEDRQAMAVLVFATTQLFPLLDMTVMLALLGAHLRRHRPVWFAPALRFIQTLRPWGMTEVFMLGVVVSLVKLSGMARILPGPALWAFAILTVLLAMILTYDPRTLWREAKHD